MLRMTEKQYHLHYKIGERRPLLVSGVSHDPKRCESMPDKHMEMVHVEWTHDIGFPPDTRELPIRYSVVDFVLANMLNKAVEMGIINDLTAESIKALRNTVFKPHMLNGDIGILTEIEGQREVLVDQLNVLEGTPLSSIIMMLEEKRPILARTLGIEP
jgi:hypothetical protein